MRNQTSSAYGLEISIIVIEAYQTGIKKGSLWSNAVTREGYWRGIKGGSLQPPPRRRDGRPKTLNRSGYPQFQAYFNETARARRTFVPLAWHSKRASAVVEVTR